MAGPLAGKRIVLGVCGSIAAYKAADLASRLVREGARVDALLTRSATNFVAPLTFRSLTNRPVPVDMFAVDSETAEEHVALARAADAIVIAPATATMLGRIALGLAEDMVSLTAIASTAPLLVAPAMDAQMWAHPAVAANVATLRSRGVTFAGPEEGRLASGHSGLGRMAEPATIVQALKAMLGRSGGDLAGRRIIVTAGGTREPVDPVRYISNHSSGKMGYAIAEAARDRGADVTLVTTVKTLTEPYGTRRVDVSTAQEMLEATRAACQGADAVIMAAAVADFRPAEPAEDKIKKRDVGGSYTIAMEETQNILKELASLPLVRIGFAAESRDLLANAREKLLARGLPLLVANDVTAEGSGFGSDTNAVTFLYADGHEEPLPLLPKYEVAVELLNRLLPLLGEAR